MTTPGVGRPSDVLGHRDARFTAHTGLLDPPPGPRPPRRPRAPSESPGGGVGVSASSAGTARRRGGTGPGPLSGRGADRGESRRRTGTALRLAGFHGAVLAVVLGAVVAALVHQFSVSYEALAANDLADELAPTPRRSRGPRRTRACSRRRWRTSR